MEKHYKLLGLETTATLEEAQKRFNVLSKEYDPEKQEGELKEFFKSEQEKVKESYKEICLHLIRKKEEEEKEKETTIEDKVVEEVTEEKVREEKAEGEYRKTIHDNKNDESALEITKKSKESLDKIVYWSYFLSIIGYIFLALLTLGVFKLIINYQDLPSRTYSSYRYGYSYNNIYKEILFRQIIIGIMYIVTFYFPVRYLNRFAKKTRLSLTYNDNRDLGEGLENLGSFFKFYGVICILSISLGIITFLSFVN